MTQPKTLSPSQISALQQANISHQVTPNGRVWCFFAPHCPNGAFAKYHAKDGRLEFVCGSHATNITLNHAISVILQHDAHHKQAQVIQSLFGGQPPQAQQPAKPKPPNAQNIGPSLSGPWQSLFNPMGNGVHHSAAQAGPADDDDDDDNDDDQDDYTPRSNLAPHVHLVWDMYMRLVAENSCPPEAMTEEGMNRLAETAIEATEIFFQKLNQRDQS